MIDETLDVASLDLAEARAKIEAARAGLLTAGDSPAVRAAIQRLDRIETEMDRVEGWLEMPAKFIRSGKARSPLNASF